jgi:orotate phosphoribosyltransferase
MSAGRALSSSTEWQRLREIIKENSLKRDRQYQLSSGEKSGYYFDMKTTTFDPEALNLLCPMIYEMVSAIPAVYLGGLANGAIPIVSALVSFSATRTPLPGFYVREDIKDHGTQKLIEGLIDPDANVVIFDDVTTSGSSAMKAVNAVRALGCKVVKVITIVDRLEGAAERFKDEGLEFIALFTTKDFD